MKEVTTTRVGKWKIEDDAITAVGMTETEGVGEITAETGKEDLVVAVMGAKVVGELDRNSAAIIF